MILTDAELNSLVKLHHQSPHQLLGMHPLGDGSGLVVRAQIPGAASVEAQPVHEKDRPAIRLEKIHESGIYEGTVKGSNRVFAYDLIVTDHQGSRRRSDFGPSRTHYC